MPEKQIRKGRRPGFKPLTLKHLGGGFRLHTHTELGGCTPLRERGNRYGVKDSSNKWTMNPDMPQRQDAAIALPCWLFDAIPVGAKTRVLTAAIIVGSRYDGRKVTLGQTSMYKASQMRTFHLLPIDIDQLQRFGREAHLSKMSTIIRTCIMLALKMPGAERGVISPPTDYTISTDLCWDLLIRANCLTLEEHKAIRQNRLPVGISELRPIMQPMIIGEE